MDKKMIKIASIHRGAVAHIQGQVITLAMRSSNETIPIADNKTITSPKNGLEFMSLSFD